MKKVFLVVSLFSLAFSVQAQTAREEIQKDPALASGKYYAYQAPDVQLTPAPDGYEPFYISAFARHGSRYLTKEKKYAQPLGQLLAADEAGALTADGKRTLKVVAALAQEAENKYGELTPKGAQQHRELIGRMYKNYPQVFQNGIHVDARSTYKTRAFLSMAAACVELKGLNPQLNVTTNTSEADTYYIKYKNPLYEAQHLENIDSVYQAADSVYVHPQRLMKQLFKDSAYVAQNIKDPVKLMADLFELHGISQSSYNQPDLSFLFTDEELYNMWQRNNFEWYYEKGASPLSDNCMYKLERNLLNNFIETADTVIASKKNAVTLRYGHDTNLAPLAALMGINELQTSTADWQKIADTYRTYRIIPMCGNVQLIFYKKKGSKDILVKLLLNEREVRLPLATDTAPYYKWKDVRGYWKKVVDGIDLPAKQ
ncbi:histidine-type phosphatase [uncultured Bacteroides sp.]|uniref:histidine-type phosphatase n=1 Tax=uncultured Bacteroides sp. TaxID=162156 RepID=UPI00262FA13D|nr:histidine-type phosphatase [uncultured Bacteroides sp.]